MCRLLCVLTVVCGGVLIGVSPAGAEFRAGNAKIAFDSDRDGMHGNGGPVVVPAGPDVTSQWFKTFFELPDAVNPLAGNGDPCVRFTRNGRILSAIAGEGTVTCTAELGTQLNTGTNHFCSTFDPPPTNFDGRAEQRRCARALSRSVTSLTLTVDGRTIDILKPRFATFSRYTVVNLPVDNMFRADPGRHTLTSYGWEVNVRNLQVGRHVIIVDVVDGDFVGSFEHIINIVPRG